jgi:hypothetical protein
MIDGRFCVRRTAALGIAVIALAAGGCGSDDDGGGGAQGAQASGGTSKPAGSDKDQIKILLRDMQRDYNKGDGDSFCARLVKAEQRDVAAFGRNLGRGKKCQDTISTISQQTLAAGVEQRPTKFVSAKIKGRRATAMVSDGGRPPEPMLFAKVDGEWKVFDTGFEPDPLDPGPEAKSKDKKASDGG